MIYMCRKVYVGTNDRGQRRYSVPYSRCIEKGFLPPQVASVIRGDKAWDNMIYYRNNKNYHVIDFHVHGHIWR